MWEKSKLTNISIQARVQELFKLHLWISKHSAIFMVWLKCDSSYVMWSQGNRSHRSTPQTEIHAYGFQNANSLHSFSHPTVGCGQVKMVKRSIWFVRSFIYAFSKNMIKYTDFLKKISKNFAKNVCVNILGFWKAEGQEMLIREVCTEDKFFHCHKW